MPPVIGSDEEKVYYTHRYKSPFFFSADIFKVDEAHFLPLTLKKVKRQSDTRLIGALSAIRTGDDYRESLALFNRECFSVDNEAEHASLCLVPRNNQARQINQNRLDAVEGNEVTIDAEITGNVQADRWKLIVPAKLKLKIGARVIFLNNQSEWINGDLGEVVGYGEDSIRVKKLSSDNVVNVPKHVWNKYSYVYDYSSKRIEKKIIATFKQYPLALGWAITIHKSQGMTLEDYTIDLGSGAFGEGQVYVALSRSKALGSIKLLKPISMSDVKVNPVVQEFYEKIRDSFD